jgi:hypothetical protein
MADRAMQLVWAQPRPSVLTFTVVMLLAIAGVLAMVYHNHYYGVPGSYLLYVPPVLVGGIVFSIVVFRFAFPLSVFVQDDRVILTRSRLLLRLGLGARHRVKDIRHINCDYEVVADPESGTDEKHWYVAIVRHEGYSIYRLTPPSHAQGLAEALRSIVGRERGTDTTLPESEP